MLLSLQSFGYPVDSAHTWMVMQEVAHYSMSMDGLSDTLQMLISDSKALGTLFQFIINLVIAASVPSAVLQNASCA